MDLSRAESIQPVRPRLPWTGQVGTLNAALLIRLPPATLESEIQTGGHPGGGDLQFSIEDNRLVGANQKLLHYRTPTQAGSSGSPVFEDQEWKVVALHHAGKDDMQRIDGKKGTYEANEGISVQAIRKWAAKRARDLV